MRLSNEELNNIRTSIDIVDIVSEYIPLTKRGKNYFGVCPFHEDSDPSLSVSQEKQIFSCFSCHTSGNAFTFVKEYEHISFMEAVKLVASKANIDIDIGNIKKNSKEDKLYEMYETSLKFYQNNLNTNAGKVAKLYLHNRFINDELIKEFNIGLALKSDDMLSKLLNKKDYDEKLLLESGLVTKIDNNFKDLFRSRIMFPIHDINGKVVGYSGRIYDQDDTSKYINTKETKIFKKGELLYNYYKAKNEARLKNTIIITEGFLDVIRLSSIGIKNVVATMGTALTKKHVNLIKRLANNVILLFDGDKAGLKATLSCIELLNDLNIKIVRLEDNLDPDEYILQKGKDEFLAKLENPIDVLQFKTEYFKLGKNLNSSEELALYVNQVIDEISKSDDDILKEITLQKLSKETNLDYEFLKSKIKVDKKVKLVKKPNITYNKYEKAQIELLYYMLLSGEVIKIFDNQTLYLPIAKYRTLANNISYFYQKNNYIDIADLVNELDDDSIKTLGEITSLNLNEKYTKEMIMDYIRSIQEINIEEQIKRLEDKMEKEVDDLKKALLAQQLVDLKNRSEENV